LRQRRRPERASHHEEHEAHEELSGKPKRKTNELFVFFVSFAVSCSWYKGETAFVGFVVLFVS
jgi:hypothetical protein